jgi:hypothetical protein
MTAQTAATFRELAARENDGIRVRLIWDTGRDRLLLVIEDLRTEETFELTVPRDRGLDAFYHPFSFVAPPTRTALPSHAEQGAA